MPIDTETQGDRGTKFRHRGKHRGIFGHRFLEHVGDHQQTQQSYWCAKHLRQHTDTKQNDEAYGYLWRSNQPCWAADVLEHVVHFSMWTTLAQEVQWERNIARNFPNMPLRPEHVKRRYNLFDPTSGSSNAVAVQGSPVQPPLCLDHSGRQAVPLLHQSSQMTPLEIMRMWLKACG